MWVARSPRTCTSAAVMSAETAVKASQEEELGCVGGKYFQNNVHDSRCGRACMELQHVMFNTVTKLGKGHLSNLTLDLRCQTMTND